MAQAKLPPALMLLTLAGLVLAVDTSTGVLLSDPPPLPSWPLLLAPQLRPPKGDPLMARLNKLPQSTSAAPLTFKTLTGTPDFCPVPVLPPLPNWPNWLDPQQEMPPPLRPLGPAQERTHVWKLPPEMPAPALVGKAKGVMHLPPTQICDCTEQTVPSLTLVKTQPLLVLQLSAVQKLLSSQPMPVCTHAPVFASQLSVVHALPSSQDLAEKTQPLLALQESMVHGLPSSQSTGLNAQFPDARSQLPVTHWLLEVHTVVTPEVHAPLTHMSPVVHKFLSSQGPLTFCGLHRPSLLSHTLVTHTLLPGSHTVTGPLTQPPLWHMSALVQASPSLQAALLGDLTQPMLASQLSSVQRLPSSQFFVGPAVQLPSTHASPTVQTLPSKLHVVPSATLLVMHAPSLGLHATVWHMELGAVQVTTLPALIWH